MSLPIAGTAPFSGANETIRLEEVSFGYGSELVVKDVSLTIPAGAFVTLLGPSGCGKTTLLRLLGGYLVPERGRIFLQGRDVTTLPPNLRQVGMVFQSYALFPHLNARQNVAFGLEVRGRAPAIVRQQVDAVLDRVGLSSEERDRYPSQLSGGQQQRVALARALAFEPPVLLLDEPLASLDRHLREQVRLELCRIHRQSAVTTVMVTHDQEEALASSDIVGVMQSGRLLQVGTPRELYDRPLSPFVARFLGDANLIEGRRLGMNPTALVLIRPERVQIGSNWPGRVMAVNYHGADLVADVQCSDFVLKIRTRAVTELAVGDAIALDLPQDNLWEIPAESTPR
ncbi:MAG: ABC transporter ATP-binding protein [Planctomycetota bacterium]